MATPLLGGQTTAASGSTVSQRHSSCTGCHKRKIKCDGKRPCSRCVKDEADCRVDRRKGARSGTRGGAESPSNAVLALKLQQYERLLHAHGIDLEGRGTSNEDEPMGDVESAVLSNVEDGGTDSQSDTLWDDLGHRRTLPGDDAACTENTHTVLHADDSATAELLIWGRPNFVSLRPLHPTVPQIMLLWQIFLNNFDPLVKLFHAPTVQVAISDAATNLDSIAPNTEALMFAIYLSATVTMTEHQCLQALGTSKGVLVKRLANATQQALVNAQFLKSTDLVVLQVLTLYLLAARSYIDKQAMWVLAGIAVRLGETMGLHEERNLELLPPFEAEIRRRLWSQIHLINGCPARRSGGGGDSATTTASDCNDSDLFPSMTKLPGSPQERGTEMLFCALHREVGHCLALLKSAGTHHGPRRGLASQLEILSGFDSRLEGITRKCDPSIPLHLFTVLTARSVSAQLRFAAHAGARFDQGLGTDTSALRSRASLLEDAVAILGYDSEMHSNQGLRPFLWHPVVQFPFDAFVFVLQELRDGLDGEECEAAWALVNGAYEDHPELVVNGAGSPLYSAAGDLAVRAWDKRMERVREAEPAAERMYRESFEYPVESHALGRLREQRARDGWSAGEAGEVGWEDWQGMIRETGHWRGLGMRT